MNTNTEFANIVVSCTPTEFIGLAKFLGVKILTEDIDPETKTAIPRPAQDIVMDILDTYEKLGRSGRRALVRAMRRMYRE